MTGIEPELIADSVVSLTSLIGLVLFAQVLRMQKPRTAITKRFLFAIQVVALLLAVRLLQWVSGADWIGRLTFALAGLVPLAMLLVAETLLRRHAWLALKALVAGGAVVFAMVALLVSADHGFVAVLSLCGFQVVSFVALAVFVLGRDRQSLSVADNATIDRLALSFILIVPLAVTDFRIGFLDLPVRMSGIAILAVCWLGLTLRRSDATQSEVLSASAVLAVGLLFASICIMELAALDARTSLQVMAVNLSVGLLALIFHQARLVRYEDRAWRVLDVMADASLNEHEAFIEALQKKALTFGALILDAGSLADFDTTFQDHFAKQSIVSLQDVDQIEDQQLAEQFRWFFRKFETSHVALVSKDPFRIMALNVPTLARSRQLEQELRIAQRIAILLADRDTSHG